MSDLYVIHCDACSYHKVEKPKDINLPQITRTNIQKDISVSKETVKKPIQYKCPKCGRGVTLRKFNVKLEKQNEQENNNSGCETSSPRREVPPNFTG